MYNRMLLSNLVGMGVGQLEEVPLLHFNIFIQRSL